MLYSESPLWRSQSVVNRFVSGERGISLETASKLCEYLNVELVSRRQ
jgi:hypothetical protein